MQLMVHKPKPYNGGAVTLTFTADRVRLWNDSKKKTAIDATTYDTTNGIATWNAWGGGGDRTIWVEIIKASGTVGDAVLTLSYAGTSDTVIATREGPIGGLAKHDRPIRRQIVS